MTKIKIYVSYSQDTKEDRLASEDTFLARKANSTSIYLVITRELLTKLAWFQHRLNAALGSVKRVDLGNLTEDAVSVLLQHSDAKQAGTTEIKSYDTELLASSHEFYSHTQNLNLMGYFFIPKIIGNREKLACLFIAYWRGTPRSENQHLYNNYRSQQ